MKTQPYLKTINECNLDTYFDTIHVKESNDLMLEALFYLAEDEDFHVFVKFHVCNKVVDDSSLLYNINEFLNDKTLGYTYSYHIEKFYVCVQRPFEILADDLIKKAPINPLATDEAQFKINFVTIVGFLLGFFTWILTDSINGPLVCLANSLVFIIYNMWVYDYLNRDRFLSEEALKEKYGQ